MFTLKCNPHRAEPYEAGSGKLNRKKTSLLAFFIFQYYKQFYYSGLSKYSLYYVIQFDTFQIVFFF